MTEMWGSLIVRRVQLCQLQLWLIIGNRSLIKLFDSNPDDVKTKIELAKQFFVSTGSANATKKAIEDYTTKAFSVLNALNISEDKMPIT